MKKLLFLFLLTISITCFAQSPNNEIIGKWQGTSILGKKITLHFLNTSNMVLVYESTGPLNLNYKIFPGNINGIIFKASGLAEQFEFSGLYKHINKSEIKLQIFEDKNNTADFIEDNNKYDPPIIFTRLK